MRPGLAVAIVVGLALGAAAVTAQILVPRVAEAYLARAVAGLVPEHEGVTVEVEGVSALSLLQGRLERVRLEVARPRVQGVAFAWLALRGEGVRLDVGELRERRLAIRDADNLVVEAAWTGEQLTAYVRSQLPDVTDVTVELLPSAVRVRGGVRVLGRSVQASAVGTVEPAGTTGFRFVPDAIEVEGVALPEPLVFAAGALLEWHLDLSPLPFAVRIESIDVADGYVVAKGAWVPEG